MIQLDKEQQQMKYQGMELRYANDSANGNDGCSYWERGVNAPLQVEM